MKSPSLLGKAFVNVLAMLPNAKLETPHTVDLEPQRMKMEKLFDQTKELPKAQQQPKSGPPIEGLLQNIPQEKENREAEQQSVPEYKSEYTKEDFDSVDDAVVETLEKVPEGTATLKYFLDDNGDPLIKTLQHLRDTKWIEEMQSLREEQARKFKIDGSEMTAIGESGYGAFLVQSLKGNTQLISTPEAIFSAHERHEGSRGRMHGMGIAGTRDKHFMQDANDKHELPVLSLSKRTNQEIPNQCDAQLTAVGKKLLRITGKPFPIYVTRTVDERITRRYTTFGIRVSEKDINDAFDLEGIFGSPVQEVGKDGEALGICAGYQKHENEDGTVTHVVIFIGAEDVNIVSDYLDNGLPPEIPKEENEAPSYDPHDGPLGKDK